MTLKHWDDQELAKVSADLDAELEQIFDEMEIMLGPPTASGDEPDPDGDEPQRGDATPQFDGDLSLAAGQGPGRTLGDDNDASADNFESAASDISPARDKEIVELGEPLVPPLPVPGENRPGQPGPKRAKAPQPADGGLSSAAGPGLNSSAAIENDLPEAEVLPDDYDEQPPKPAAASEYGSLPLPPLGGSGLKTIADLSPDEFARLMEKSVARGVLAALKKWRR